MAEDSRPWGGTVTGDAGPYSEDQWGAIYRTMVGITAKAPTNLSGVSRSELNELVVTGAATPLSVASGRAMVHGTWYESTAAVSVAVAVPAGATRIDRIVLRKDWTLQTIRVFRIAGVEGGGAPALVQTDGVTWDMPLIQVSVTTGGVYTITDERQFFPFGLILEGSNLSEATTTSLSAVDLISVSGLSIRPVTPILILFNVRKTTGAAATMSIGLKLNGTEVLAPQQCLIASDAARSFMYPMFLGSRVTNYLRSVWIPDFIENVTITPPHVLSADMPAVDITDIVIRALTGDALVTVGVDELRVYSLMT